MTPFDYLRAADVDAALAGIQASGAAAYIAGGTDLLQLLQEGIVASDCLVDISGLPCAGLVEHDDRIEIGATMRLADIARHPVVREAAPVVAQALAETASPQVRNMATLGGNLLQRTRCLYFRDPAAPCNKRAPGSGCGAMDGCNRINAILGGSAQCIAAGASDLAVALTCADAELRLHGEDGERRAAIGSFYLLPGDTPEIETCLTPGELIVGAVLPRSARTRRSAFVKLRDRETFEWALASCAAAVELDGDTVRSVRLVAGAVAPVPWRLRALEDMLAGQRLDARAIAGVAECAADGAAPRPGNDFKTELLRTAVARALQRVARP
jgi:xanthine dehydrogenase YagS FAD-binding subunit